MEKNANATLRKKIGKVVVYILLFVFALYTLMPLLFLLLNSFKGQSEIIRNPLAFPKSFSFQYLINAFEQLHFLRALGITIGITIISLIPIVVFSSMAAWIMTRHKSKVSNALYLAFVAAMLIPFQAIMYPLISMMDNLGLKNVPGLIIMYAGFNLAMSIFLYCGAIKSVPKDIEEAALIDGASILQMFFGIVFPLVKSTTVTVVILSSMGIWNDYLLPFLTLGTSKNKTLVLELYYAKMTSGQYGNPWELVFPAVLICCIPLILAFLCLQKYFVQGISDGAVK